MENKKKLDNLSEEQIDGSTIKGGSGRMRPRPLVPTPPVGGPQHTPPPTGSHIPPGHLPPHGPEEPLDPLAGAPGHGLPHPR